MRFNEFQPLNESKVKTIKVGEDAVTAKNPHYALIQNRTVMAVGEKQEMLDLCEKEGGRVWLCAKGVGELVEGEDKGKRKTKDPCWKGYKQVGMKDKNGKEVPNCVPESNVKESSWHHNQYDDLVRRLEQYVSDHMQRDPQDPDALVVSFNGETFAADTFQELYQELYHYVTRYNLTHMFEENELEEGGRCTKVTKKASSTRKDKKWMKCATQSDGSIKRVHWGDPNAKVTGKSGNTKRKKNFRSRHNCSNAKKGSARAQACKDW